MVLPCKFLQSRDKEAIELGTSLLGVPYIGLPVIAMIWLRSDTDYGFSLIIYLFVIVWSVDIFAYLSGRSFGGPKLAPSISPKKTWSGFIGGVCAGTLAGVLFSQYLGNQNLLPIAIMALAIGIFSQMGDLFESVFKRHYNVKDASNLIPGHGGLFDRVDGLLFAACAGSGDRSSCRPGPSWQGVAVLGRRLMQQKSLTILGSNRVHWHKYT